MAQQLSALLFKADTVSDSCQSTITVPASALIMLSNVINLKLVNKLYLTVKSMTKKPCYIASTY